MRNPNEPFDPFVLPEKPTPAEPEREDTYTQIKGPIYQNDRTGQWETVDYEPAPDKRSPAKVRP